MALKNNTWKLNQWYDQSVAGNVSYSGNAELFSWGINENGQLGQNRVATAPKYSSPVQIPGTTWAKNLC
jgi:alpha-tubulin suppressor-like RCC1 family protein